MRYFIETIGCQMNVCESELLSEQLARVGAVLVDNALDADLVILNTCSVRAQAEQKAFSFLGRAEELKLEKKDIKIVVIGCMAQRLGTKIKKRFNKVDLILGTKDVEGAVGRILGLFGIGATVKKIEEVCEIGSPITNFGDDKQRQSDIIRYVTIMRGCDNYCSYCVVPYVRGRETSLVDTDIIDKCRRMVDDGAREITLLGQNVNSYHYNGTSFTDLIKKLSLIENLKKIRFMTNHPKDLNDDLINMMANEPKVCKHIHLPVQSASNSVLERMNRKYTFEHYQKLVESLRKNVKGVSITTDFIVGFPGETKEDFNKTLKAVRDIRFDGLYVFRYSPRPNTKACEFVDDVSLEEKKLRHATILKESNDISIELVSQMVGTTQEVLVESFSDGVLEGRTSGGRKVSMKGSVDNLGMILKVLIKQSKVNSLFGDIL